MTPTTIPSRASDVKGRSVERNRPDQVNLVICHGCSWKYTSKPGQRPEIAVVHGKDHHRETGHVPELHCIIDVFVDTIPSRKDRSELDRR